MLRPYAPPSEKSGPVPDPLPMSAYKSLNGYSRPVYLIGAGERYLHRRSKGPDGSPRLANLVYLVAYGGLGGPRALGVSSVDW